MNVNLASKLPNAIAKSNETEFKIKIVKNTEGKFDIHLYGGCINKVLLNFDHYQVVSPFGNDAE